MYSSFHIKEDRLGELKSFIREFTPTVRFKHNPLKEGDKWFIALTMEVEDGNKLNQLFNKWDEEDNPIIEKVSLWKRIKNILSSFLYL